MRPLFVPSVEAPAENHDMVAKIAKILLITLPDAGTLEVAPGVELFSTADFPEEYKPQALAMEPADIFPG